MQTLSKAALAILERFKRDAAKFGPGAEQVPGGMVSGAGRTIDDGGGYGTLDTDERPEWLREQDEPGTWQTVAILRRR